MLRKTENKYWLKTNLFKLIFKLFKFIDLSQLPIRVLATIRGMLSGMVQLQPSMAASSLTLTSLPV